MSGYVITLTLPPLLKIGASLHSGCPQNFVTANDFVILASYHLIDLIPPPPLAPTVYHLSSFPLLPSLSHLSPLSLSLFSPFPPLSLSADSAVFGVTVEVAVQRSTLGTDQLELPTVFRQCIDFLEEHGTLCVTCSFTHTQLGNHNYIVHTWTYVCNVSQLIFSAEIQYVILCGRATERHCFIVYSGNSNGDTSVEDTIYNSGYYLISQ